MEFCVARDGESIISLGITVEYDCNDETMNVTGSLVTGELTIHKVSVELVEEVIGELG